METVLITGGAGFLGSHLCDRFLREGFRVICVDNLLTGDPDNIAHLMGNQYFEFINLDVTNFVYVPGRVDFILHFASPASPIDYLQLPIQTLKVGSLGTHKVLGLAKEKKARFLLASTSETYGDPLVHPQPESYWGNVNPIGPRGVYDEAKRFGEALVMAYHRTHGLETRIARIFNTYGTRMRLGDGRVIPAFLSQAIKGKPLSIFGSGNQTRSFCYIEDQVNGLLKLLFSDECEPVNVGNPAEYTVNDLANQIKKLFAPELEIEHHPLPTDDPKTRQPDITRAREILGWEPKIGLEEGLKRIYPWFRRRVETLLEQEKEVA